MKHLALRLRPVLALFLVFALACGPLRQQIKPTLTPEQEEILATADSTQVNVDSLRVVFEAEAEQRAKKEKRILNIVGVVLIVGAVALLVATYPEEM